MPWHCTCVMPDLVFVVLMSQTLRRWRRHGQLLSQSPRRSGRTHARTHCNHARSPALRTYHMQYVLLVEADLAHECVQGHRLPDSESSATTDISTPTARRLPIASRLGGALRQGYPRGHIHRVLHRRRGASLGDQQRQPVCDVVKSLYPCWRHDQEQPRPPPGGEVPSTADMHMSTSCDAHDLDSRRLRY